MENKIRSLISPQVLADSRPTVFTSITPQKRKKENMIKLGTIVRAQLFASCALHCLVGSVTRITFGAQNKLEL